MAKNTPLGRPRKFMAPVNVSVTFDADELPALEDAARHANLTVSEYLRRLAIRDLSESNAKASPDDASDSVGPT